MIKPRLMRMILAEDDVHFHAFWVIRYGHSLIDVHTFEIGLYVFHNWQYLHYIGSEYINEQKAARGKGKSRTQYGLH
jgi:hypothetical protein